MKIAGFRQEYLPKWGNRLPTPKKRQKAKGERQKFKKMRCNEICWNFEYICRFLYFLLLPFAFLLCLFILKTCEYGP